MMSDFRPPYLIVIPSIHSSSIEQKNLGHKPLLHSFSYRSLCMPDQDSNSNSIEDSNVASEYIPPGWIQASSYK